MKLCSIEGCTGKGHAKGLCREHYKDYKSKRSDNVVKFSSVKRKT
jgi:hypothetical protein